VAVQVGGVKDREGLRGQRAVEREREERGSEAPEGEPDQNGDFSVRDDS
jgi:hypothetical protein